MQGAFFSSCCLPLSFGCYNRVPQTGQLTQQLFLTVCRPGVHIRVPAWSGSGEVLFGKLRPRGGGGGSPRDSQLPLCPFWPDRPLRPLPGSSWPADADGSLLAVPSPGGESDLWCVLMRTLSPSGDPTLVTSSKSSHLPKAPPPNTIPLWVRASAYEIAGDVNIQSTAVAKTFH